MATLIVGLFLILTIHGCTCAYQEPQCQNAGGTCQLVTQTCSGNYLSGQCPRQPNNVKCCIHKGARQEAPCANAGGICMKTSFSCSGNFLSGKCPTQPNDVKCCVQSRGSTGTCDVGVDKYTSTVNRIFGHEGLCQNSANDRGNMFQGKRGYTCMGITPEIGYVNRASFSGCAPFSGTPANFVKWCYDKSASNFKIGATKIFKNKYFHVCDHLQQPAFYVCCDISVNSGPGRAQKYIRELGPVGNDVKSYARRLNEKHRQLYRSIGGPNLQGWLNRADARDRYINSCT